MNFLANGGRLAVSCKAVFKTTPTITEMSIKPLVYPSKPQKILQMPPTTLRDDLYKKLPTGNISVRTGYSTPSENISYAAVCFVMSPSNSPSAKK
ncbi:unnamed protein product [Leptosia nina]|uniref:Uncharacterized protein n=1 Tax=Leptosia nina TaxID=320188 RepID=A0AAV1J0S3_9NEOP